MNTETKEALQTLQAVKEVHALYGVLLEKVYNVIAIPEASDHTKTEVKNSLADFGIWLGCLTDEVQDQIIKKFNIAV